LVELEQFGESFALGKLETSWAEEKAGGMDSLGVSLRSDDISK
jgi:hypothetical protein